MLISACTALSARSVKNIHDEYSHEYCQTFCSKLWWPKFRARLAIRVILHSNKYSNFRKLTALCVFMVKFHIQRHNLFIARPIEGVGFLCSILIHGGMCVCARRGQPERHQLATSNDWFNNSGFTLWDDYDTTVVSLWIHSVHLMVR